MDEAIQVRFRSSSALLRYAQPGLGCLSASSQAADKVYARTQALVVDYSLDEELEWKRGDFLKLRTYDECVELMAKGERHMDRLFASGVVHEQWETSEFLLPSQHA